MRDHRDVIHPTGGNPSMAGCHHDCEEFDLSLDLHWFAFKPDHHADLNRLHLLVAEVGEILRRLRG